MFNLIDGKEPLPGYIQFVLHDPEGRIISGMNLPESGFKATYEGKEGVALGYGTYSTHYVEDGNIIDRPIQATTLDGLILNKLPSPCQILINEATYDCSHGNAELEFDMPGTYQITVKAWPYLDAEFIYEN